VRIAIVDDDRILLEGLTALLSRSNMQVTTLSEPSRFWEMLEAARPDLLILDLDMPTYNGIELCRAVRTDPQWATLPIMFLTAHTATIAIDRVFAAGADDLVTKPTLAAELVTRIANRLERLEQRAIARSR
jgi:DNA-binding response OmpR family regulator